MLLVFFLFLALDNTHAQIVFKDDFNKGRSPQWKQINDTVSVSPEEEDNLYNEEIYENYLEQGDTP